jgi:hypothetical protein
LFLSFLAWLLQIDHHIKPEYAATKLAARTSRRRVRYRGSPSHVAWPELEKPPNAEGFGGGVKKLS